MTTVINLLGGPSCGKSTLAAELYAKMKHLGLKVEMVREVAKEWAWEGRAIGAFDQMAILGEQIKRESSLYGKVDYIITDSPVLLGAFYFQHNHKQEFMSNMVFDYYNYSLNRDVNFKNFKLIRTKDYEKAGRFESKEQALNIDNALTDFLVYWDYSYKNLINIQTDSADDILEGLGLI